MHSVATLLREWLLTQSWVLLAMCVVCVVVSINARLVTNCVLASLPHAAAIAKHPVVGHCFLRMVVHLTNNREIGSCSENVLGLLNLLSTAQVW